MFLCIQGHQNGRCGLCYWVPKSKINTKGPKFGHEGKLNLVPIFIR